MTSRTWGPDGSGIPISSANLNGIETDITNATNTANAAIPSSQKGAASGVASLDASTLVPVAQLPAATTGAKGAVQLAGDLAGTATAVTVAKVNGVAVTGTPTSGQVITASSGTAAAWASPSGGIPQPATETTWWAILSAGADAGNSAIDSAQYCYPMQTGGQTVTAAGIWVNTASGTAGSTMQISGYSLSSAGVFTNLFNFGAFATDTTGFKSITATVTLPNGFWWLGVKHTANGGAFQGVNIVPVAMMPYANSANGPSTANASAGKYGLRMDNNALTTTVGGTTNAGGWNAFGAGIAPPKIWVQLQ